MRPQLRSLTLNSTEGYFLMDTLGPRLHQFARLEELALDGFTGERDEAAAENHPRPTYSLRSLRLAPSQILAVDDDGAADLHGEYAGAALAWFLGHSQSSLRRLGLVCTSPKVIDTLKARVPGLETLCMSFSSCTHDGACLVAHRQAAAKALPGVRFEAGLFQCEPPDAGEGGDDGLGADAGQGSEGEGGWDPEDVADCEEDESGLDSESDSDSDVGISWADHEPNDGLHASRADLDRWRASQEAQLDYTLASDDDDDDDGDDDGGGGDDWTGEWRDTLPGFAEGGLGGDWEEDEDECEAAWGWWPAEASAARWDGEDGCASEDSIDSLGF